VSLVATLVCAPLLILGSALMLMLLVMVDRPDRTPAAPAPHAQPELRRAA